MYISAVTVSAGRNTTRPPLLATPGLRNRRNSRVSHPPHYWSRHYTPTTNPRRAESLLRLLRHQRRSTNVPHARHHARSRTVPFLRFLVPPQRISNMDTPRP